MAGTDHRGWYKHDGLPHYDCAGLYQLITFRLDDSLPRAQLARLEMELGEQGLAKPALEAARRKRIEALLDRGFGSCILQHRRNADLVISAWRHFDGRRYDLILGVVMPNHVHVLVGIHAGTRLGELVASWKSFTSRRFAVDGALGYVPHWQRGYWDRFIRDEAHFEAAVRYVAFNPVTAGLVPSPRDWPYLAYGRMGALECDAPSDALAGVLASRSTRRIR